MSEIVIKDAETTLSSAPIVAPSVWTDKAAFDQLARSAGMLAKTNLVPQAYQNKPEDCFLALEIASRMNVSPMVVMQNMYVVKGKPSWAGQACIMLINNCGKFKDVRHVYTGTKGTDSRGCYVEAVRISNGETVQGTEVTMQMAKNEGWLSNPKWKNMPELMLAYRAGAFFARVHCPEAMMGVQTAEEVYDAAESQKTTAATLNEQLQKRVAKAGKVNIND